MQELRNIAIIAHVDHGKTTLVDALLKQAMAVKVVENESDDLIMDSNELERERGITIFAKNASVEWGDIKVNILDTPGHADFGGEVERVLTMADGALLLVDAKEGPMPQTRFVLKKALELGLKVILVINKMDKPEARHNYVLDETFDLFIELGATNEQADFPVVYAIGKKGVASMSPELDSMKNIAPIFDTIIKNIAPAKRDVEGSFQFLAVSTDMDDYKGRIATGRVRRGHVKSGETVMHIKRDGTRVPVKITSLMTSVGIKRATIEEVEAGDIVHISGSPDIQIGETLTSMTDPEALPVIHIDPPTIKVMFLVNTSPFAGKEGTYVTSRQLRERLFKELERDVALHVEETDSADRFLVSGRGELHLGILIERMRREGYEFQVGKPEVIYLEENGVKLEPYEQVFIEVPETHAGVVIEKLGARGAQMRNLHVREGITHLDFVIATSRLFGYRSKFLTDTKGLGIMNTLFHGFEPSVERLPLPHGSIVAYEAGKTTAFALENAQLRGQMFVGPGEEVYRGQVVGQASRDEDMEINICKAKQLTNMRSSSSDGLVMLDPHRPLNVDTALEYLGDDELMEATPKSVRVRKITEGKRKGS
ncbi:MAG: translational GTPase TypA [Candidatus Vogelbacteria bacterium]|nr:translational GTPase TypA [Candidatus Vogelbacteria bacterium]